MNEIRDIVPPAPARARESGGSRTLGSRSVVGRMLALPGGLLASLLCLVFLPPWLAIVPLVGVIWLAVPLVVKPSAMSQADPEPPVASPPVALPTPEASRLHEPSGMPAQRGEPGRSQPGLPDADLSGRGADATWMALIDALPDAALVLSEAGAVIHYNALAADQFPRVRAGMAVTQMLRHPELIEAVDRVWALNEPVTVQLIERVPVERRIAARLTRLDTAFQEPRGTAPALLITFSDLSDQDQLTRMRADFIANASHELRTPLASLRGFIETLQGPAKNDPAARERFLGMMASQATRMTRLIDDLLSLSRIEMKQHLPPVGVVELGEVVAYVCQTLEPLAADSGITLNLKRLGRPARIRGDREEILQVVQNLVHNAIKYGREGGSVEVGVSRLAGSHHHGAQLAVAVSDDGAGIAKHHLPRLVERFYRVNVASSREKGGTGLGLAIVKHVMNRHRGELKIESVVGKGSTFTVVFDELESAGGV